MAILLTEILKQSILQRPETYERSLMHCLIQSVRFYRSLRPMLCPYNDKTFTYRSDFSVPRYNHLFAALDACWRMYDTQTFDADVFLPKETLENSLVDISNAAPPGSRVVETMAALLEELNSDFYAPNAAALASPEIMTALKGDVFSFWLDLRLAKHVNREITSMALETPLTLGAIKDLVKSHDISAVGTRDNIISIDSLIVGSSIHNPKLPTHLKSLNDRIGGGLGFGEVTMVAGNNGGGKSVLAADMAMHFAIGGRRVAFFTTEERPTAILGRMISNALNINMNEFSKRRDGIDGNLAAYELTNIPAWIHTDPTFGPKLKTWKNSLESRVQFVDWSQGQSYDIVSHFDAEIDNLCARGYPPDVIIFDWIGGALSKAKKPEEIRHHYAAGIDHIVEHTKKYSRVGVVLAQTDKTLNKGQMAVTMAMLSECKTMTNRISTFLGLSFIREKASDDKGTFRNLARKQFIHIDKSRYGSGGSCPVEIQFEFQRFTDRPRTTVAGGSDGMASMR